MRGRKSASAPHGSWTTVVTRIGSDATFPSVNAGVTFFSFNWQRPEPLMDEAMLDESQLIYELAKKAVY
jgi:hypothetical protein